jgi:hypothetical protein
MRATRENEDPKGVQLLRELMLTVTLNDTTDPRRGGFVRL